MKLSIALGFFVAASALCLVAYSGDDVADHTIPTLVVEPPILIRANAKMSRVTVTPYGTGQTIIHHGTISAGPSDCTSAPDSIYCNTAGASLFGLGGGSATARWSDDIIPVASKGCLIDRYVIRVTGDKQQDGSGVALGGYRVDYALYQTCPGAEFTPRVIAGTEGFVEVPAGDEVGDILEIVHQVPAFVDATLPSVEFFLGVEFSRDKCAVVGGAPALKGYSADRVDVPGGACKGSMGSGFNSFYAEIYTRDECPETHVGYRNSNQGQAANSVGVNKRLADDVVLPEDCMLVAYEVSFKKAAIEIDLRTSLADEEGPFIPGTRAQFQNILGFDVQVAHVDVDPPFRLAAGFTYWFTAKSNNSSLGVVQTCEPPLIGESANLFMAFNSGTNTWEVEDENNANCFGGFDVTLYCEGASPPGACCDMVLKECLGGKEEGKPCKIGAQCDGLRCESVCRDVPEINCTGDSIGAPLLWREGETCGPSCVGGGKDGQACAGENECPDGQCEGAFCVGGERDGSACTRAVDCPGGSCEGGPFFRACGLSACCKPVEDPNNPGICENLTENECFAVPPQGAPRDFQTGRGCGVSGQRCPLNACIEGTGSCCESHSSPGCIDRFCCTDVCSDPNFFFCCEFNWTQFCANRALDICKRQLPDNDECYGRIECQLMRAQLIRIPDIFQANSISATPDVPSDGTGPGFCCNTENPGGHGVGSLWYKFIAVDTSVRISTCTTDTRVVFDVEYRGEDSMIAVYSVPDTRRGICADLSPCDVQAADCADGSQCVFDEQFACENLSPMACNDDEKSCDAGFEPKRSTLCVTGLVPGSPYYVQIAGKSNEPDPIDPNDPPTRPIVRGNGVWRVVINSPCTNAMPQMINDACADGEAVTGGDVEPIVTQFDLSGTILGQCMEGSTPGVQCVIAQNDCPGGGSCSAQAPATFDCPGPPASCLFNTMENDIWYNWTAPANGEGLVDACGFSNLPTPDTGMVVYEGCECPADDRRIMGCSWLETSPCLGGSKVRFSVTAGTCYQIRLGGHLGGEPQGQLKFSVSDFCGNRQPESNRCVGGENANLECIDDAGCPDGKCGEECDSGLGCLDNCECGLGYEPSFFPSPNCSAICGDGMVVPKEQCDGGVGCSLFCTCDFGWEPAEPPGLDCVRLCGNGQIDFGEQCDGGLGCCEDCKCCPGFEAALPAALHCDPLLCEPASPGKPACNGILPRKSGTVISLQYPSDPVPCLPSIRIRELLANGAYGPDLSSQFSIHNESGNLVKLTDNDAALANRTWYGITDDGGTKIDYLVIYGDVDGDGDTDALDVNAIWRHRLDPVTDNTRYDIDGDGDVDALDASAAWHSRDALVGPVPAKPDGHDCPAP